MLSHLKTKGLEIVSLHVFWDSIYELCQESVHREGVDPNSMEGVRDLDHISVDFILASCISDEQQILNRSKKDKCST